MTTDIAAATPSRQALAAVERSAKGQVTGRLRTALLTMIWEGACRAVAAETAGMTDHSLRAALKKPHVRQFYLSELDVLKTSERARNVLALVDVRDNSSNSISRVQAARTLEQLSEEAETRPRGQYPQTPGLVVVIRAPSSAIPKPAPATIDVEPMPEHADEPTR
jgi:hypothetical protein